MVKIKMTLTEQDLEKIKELKERTGYLLKDIEYDNSNIGMIEIMPKRLVDENYKCVDKFFEIKFFLGSHEGEEPVRKSVILTYTLLYENIMKVLIGEHILINTVDGERILIEISK